MTYDVPTPRSPIDDHFVSDDARTKKLIELQAELEAKEKKIKRLEEESIIFLGAASRRQSTARIEENVSDRDSHGREPSVRCIRFPWNLDKSSDCDEDKLNDHLEEQAHSEFRRFLELHQERIHNLERENGRLSTLCEQKTKLLSRSQAHAHALESELDEMAVLLSDSNKEKHELKQAIKSMQDEMLEDINRRDINMRTIEAERVSLLQQIHEVLDDNKKIRAELEQWETRGRSWMDEHDILRNHMEKIVSESALRESIVLNECERKADVVRKVLEENTRTIQDMMLRRTEQEQLIEHLQEELHQLQAEYRLLQDEAHRREQMREELERDRASVAASLDIAQRANTLCTRQLLVCEVEMEELRETLMVTQGESERLQQLSAELEFVHHDACRERDAIRKRLLHVEEQHAQEISLLQQENNTREQAFHQRCQSYEEQLVEFSREVQELRSSVRELRAENDSWGNRYQQCKESAHKNVIKKEDELRRLQSTLSSNQEAMARVEQHNKELASSVAFLQQSREHESAQLAKCKRDLDLVAAKEMESAGTIHELMEKVAHNQERILELEATIRDQHAQYEETVSALQASNDVVQSYQQKHAQLSNEWQCVVAQLEREFGASKRYQEEVRSMQTKLEETIEQCHNLQEKLRQAQEGHTQAEKRATHCESELHIAQSRYAEVERCLTRTQEKVKQLQVREREMEQQLIQRSLERDNTHIIEGKLRAVEALLVEKEDETTKLMEELAKTKRDQRRFPYHDAQNQSTYIRVSVDPNQDKLDSARLRKYKYLEHICPNTVTNERFDCGDEKMRSRNLNYTNTVAPQNSHLNHAHAAENHLTRKENLDYSAQENTPTEIQRLCARLNLVTNKDTAAFLQIKCNEAQEELNTLGKTVCNTI